MSLYFASVIVHEAINIMRISILARSLRVLVVVTKLERFRKGGGGPNISLRILCRIGKRKNGFERETGKNDPARG